MLPGVIRYDKKRKKRPYLCFWFAGWWKAPSFFSSPVDSFNSQLCFHERHKVDQKTQLQKKKKVHSSFVLRTVRSKEFFWRQNRWVFPLYTYKWNKHVLCTFTEHRASGQNQASLCLVNIHTRKTLQSYKRNRHLESVTYNWGNGNRISIAVFQGTCAE